MGTGKILIGWCERDITPKGKVALFGQFHERVTEEVHDPLYATALAFEAEDGSEQAIIISLDVTCVSDYTIKECRNVLREKLKDFDPDKIIISATHTHTAPLLPGIWPTCPGLGSDVMSKKEYADFLIQKVSEAAILAWNSRKPGALSWGRGHAVVGFNRLVSYFDGSIKMYGETNVPEFSHISGYEDHSIDLLFTYNEAHTLTGMIINIPCPSQCSEMECFISADYWHETRKEVRKHYGNDLFILSQCSAAGDMSPRPMINRRADARMLAIKGFGNDYDFARRQDIANKVIVAINEVLPLVSKEIHDDVKFKHKIDRMDITRRIVTNEDLKTAKKEVALWQKKFDDLKDMDPTSFERSTAYRRVVFYKSVIDLYKEQQKGEKLKMFIELHALRIGDIAMCTNRFEYFLDFGLRIKARSKALQTFIVQLAGEGIYVPTERVSKGGSYSGYIAGATIGPLGGQEIVEKQVESINSFYTD